MHHFTNSTLLERCGQARGLREHVCFNTTLHGQLLQTHPHFAAFCAEIEGRNCLLQRFFDRLPAPYEFDTSQLCVDPAPLLLEAVHKLSVCEVEGRERKGFLVVLGYVLRVLDFMVGLSSGLDEGESEARQGLGQAILLSSLVDNTSWTKVEPEASTSILQTVGVFLRREQNATLKEDLLSCFSVRTHTLCMHTNTHTRRNSLSRLISPSCGTSSSGMTTLLLSGFCCRYLQVHI